MSVARAPKLQKLPHNPRLQSLETTVHPQKLVNFTNFTKDYATKFTQKTHRLRKTQISAVAIQTSLPEELQLRKNLNRYGTVQRNPNWERTSNVPQTAPKTVK